MLEIMRLYGWDYEKYKSQPTWVIELIHKKLEIEGKLAIAANTTHV